MFTAQANPSIVTSNANSGAGTLREAIGFVNANGTAVVDYIHFNIADHSATGETIFVTSATSAEMLRRYAAKICGVAYLCSL